MNDEISALQRTREKNIAELNALFAPLVDESQNKITEFKSTIINHEIVEKPKLKRRHTFVVPEITRKSARIANIEPVNPCDYLNDVFESEDKLYIRQKVPSISRHGPPNHDFRKVEDITDEELNQIATTSVNKTYSQLGTSCHQCRQKTLDMKTLCRSGYCIGVRGQFCGPCLKNRYGESVREALLTPHWECPPCRNLCNCSICRTRQGKMPTGILAPIVQQEGFESVKDFLLKFENHENTPKKDDYKHFIKEMHNKMYNKSLTSQDSNNYFVIEQLNILLESYIVKIWQSQLKNVISLDADDDIKGFCHGVPIFVNSTTDCIEHKYRQTIDYIVTGTADELILLSKSKEMLKVLIDSCVVRIQNYDDYVNVYDTSENLLGFY